MKVKIKSLPPSGPIQVEDNAITQISPSFYKIGGETHANGGTDVTYLGNQVEMQKNEPISLNSQGDLVAWGKLKVPGTKQTFESAAKDIAQDEVKVSKQADKAVNLVNSNDPYNKFQALSFNTGIVLGNAAQIKQQELDTKREVLGQVQQNILDTANKLGIDPKKVSKMKNGGTLKVKIKSLPQSTNTFVPQAQNGTTLTDQQLVANWIATSPDVYGNPGYAPANVRPNAQGTLAQRNNNPGNLRFNNQKGATKGDAGFAKFNSYQEGYQALLNDIKAKQTGKTKTGLGPNSSILDLMNVYSPAEDNNDPQRLASTLAQGLGVNVNSKIGDLDTKRLADLIAINEDAAYATSQGNTPRAIPQQQSTEEPGMTPEQFEEYRRQNYISNFPRLDTDTTPNRITTDIRPQAQIRTEAPEPIQFINQSRPQRQPLRNRFNYLSILPEIGALLDRPDFVQLQQYTPNLYEPYRVSYQDQINQNQANFNQVAQLAGNNPAALSTLAANLYSANNQVLANEFRQNQAIQNQITNQNIELLNQAQLQNIQLRDQQFARQSQARANTDAAKQAALASISNKVQQNRAVNNQLGLIDYQNRLAENFSGYRDLNGTGELTYIGPDAQINIGGQPASQSGFQNMTQQERQEAYNWAKLNFREKRLQQDQNKLNYQKNNWFSRIFR